jgi:tetratricopeptide (TPR) repeat protein
MSLPSRLPFRALCALALLGALVLSGAGLAAPVDLPACDHATQPRWYRATSAHFRIRTSLDEDSARRAARELERLRDALRSLWGPAFDPPGRLDVLLLRGRELARFTAPSVDGFLAEDGNDVPLMVLAVRGERFEERADRSTLAHEMAHHLTRFLFRRESRWVNEGLASFLETVRLAEGPAGTVLGMPQEGHLKYLRAHGCLPLEALWRWDERPKLEDPGLHDLYASSWLWMHYLFGRHHERLTRFEKALYDAKEPHQAWKESFGDVAEQELEEGLREYVRGNVYQATSFAAPPEPPPARVEALPSADVHAAWALLWLHTVGGRPREERLSRARPEVQRALSEDASNVAAGVLRSGMSRDEAERLALARALVKARPDAGEAWSLLGRALQTAEAPLAEREEAFLRAVALLPDSASTQEDLARHYLLRGLPDKALEPATRAWQMAPSSAFSLEPYAMAALRLGYCDDGLRSLRQALSVAGARASTPPESLRALGDRLSRYERACAEAGRIPPAK